LKILLKLAFVNLSKFKNGGYLKMLRINGVTILRTILFRKDNDSKAEITEVQYEIEIDDTALFNEVYDKFIILERRDDHIFLVIERNPSNKIYF